MNPTAPPQRDEPPMLWIGLPAHNEEATLAALFARFFEVFPGKSLPYRIVLYNDGSRSPSISLLPNKPAREAPAACIQ